MRAHPLLCRLLSLFLIVGIAGPLAGDAEAGFVEVGNQMGVAYNSLGRSVLWADFDGDGWLDLYVGNVGENNLLMRNRIPSGLPFVNVAVARGVTNTAYPSWSVTSVDYDNDGDLDFFVANDFLFPCRLYRNDNWLFADVALALGATGDENDMGVSFADMDRDGDLDFMLSIWGPNLFYRGDGRTGFKDISPDMGTASLSIGFQVAWADWDGDGDPDLFNANMPNNLEQESHLYRNDGGYFAEVSLAKNLNLKEDALGASWADFDRDGDMDLFVARGYFAGMGAPGPNRLYRNDGSDFVDIAPQFAEMADTNSSMSGIWGDYDLDGDLDLFVDGGHDNQLFRNDNSSFVNVASQEGMIDSTNTGPGRGASWGDYDRDGDLDLVLVHRGGTIRLYRNDNANGNHWLTLHLEGVASNRSAIGTRVEVTANGNTQYHEISAGDGYFSQQSLPLELGVGSATNVTVVVEWPNGIQQQIVSLPVDQEFTVLEDYPVLEQLKFNEISATAGVDDAGDGRGSAWADYDADGDLDLFVANFTGANRLWRNDGGAFVEVGALLGVDDAASASLSATFADFDNDGLLDLYVSNNGSACRLYQNTGSGFTDVAGAMGIGNVDVDHWGAAWADYDGDGDVDLYQTRKQEPNSLYRNDGSGFFDIAPALGVDYSGRQRMATWGDYDNDGLLDLYLVNIASNALLRNTGSGFTDVSVAAGVDDGGRGAGASWGDWDNDGDLDLYVANDGPNKFYENQGAGTFLPKESTCRIGYAGLDYSPVWADWDADGELDLALVSDGGTIRLLDNIGTKFRDIGVLKGIGDYGYARSAGWADYDNDGDLDFYAARDGEANRFYERTGSEGGNWLRIRPTGVVSNHAGIGARIEVEVGGVVQTRVVQAGSGWLSQGDLWPQFGLGAATTADRVTIFWPSGIEDEYLNVASQQDLLLQEGATVTGVTDAAPGRPLAIIGNYPNPFNPVTRIAFDLPQSGLVTLDIYDASGRHVRRLTESSLPAGRNTVLWDGHDESGRSVSSGIYFSRLLMNGDKRTNKMLLLR